MAPTKFTRKLDVKRFKRNSDWRLSKSRLNCKLKPWPNLKPNKQMRRPKELQRKLKVANLQVKVKRPQLRKEGKILPSLILTLSSSRCPQ